MNFVGVFGSLTPVFVFAGGTPPKLIAVFAAGWMLVAGWVVTLVVLKGRSGFGVNVNFKSNNGCVCVCV